jgi:hypothetical protein
MSMQQEEHVSIEIDKFKCIQSRSSQLPGMGGVVGSVPKTGHLPWPLRVLALKILSCVALTTANEIFV